MIKLTLDVISTLSESVTQFPVHATWLNCVLRDSRIVPLPRECNGASDDKGGGDTVGDFDDDNWIDSGYTGDDQQ